jgi:antitoxin CptB
MDKFSQLKWQCRRGMKELDLVLTRYLEQHYEKASTLEKHTFQNLLKLPDPDLYAYLIGAAKPTQHETLALLEKIKHLV